MFRLSHPLAPRVAYDCPLPEAITRYVQNHLHVYDVFIVSAENAVGVAVEVFDKASSILLGLVEIHKTAQCAEIGLE